MEKKHVNNTEQSWSKIDANIFMECTELILEPGLRR